MRTMTNLTNQQAEENGWDILVPCNFKVLAKATYRDNNNSIMKSTKRFDVPGGWVYNTSTEIRKTDGHVAVAEALVFVPRVTVKNK